MTVSSPNREHSRDSTVNGISNGIGNTEKLSIAGTNWSDPGPAAFDFRSMPQPDLPTSTPRSMRPLTEARVADDSIA